MDLWPDRGLGAALFLLGQPSWTVSEYRAAERAGHADFLSPYDLVGVFPLVNRALCRNRDATHHGLASRPRGGRVVYALRGLAHVSGVLGLPVSVAALSHDPLSVLGDSHG